jgi:HK97 family phage major capsid protein
MGAGVTDNRAILEKADLALADLMASGGLLKPAQAQKFIRILIEESVILKAATVVPMKAPKQLVEKIRFGSRILRAGAEATALAPADRAKPDLSEVELDAQLFKAEIRLNDEVLEDSIERGQLKQTVMELMGEAIARDMDEVLVRGDRTSPDPFLAKFDGFLRQAQSHVVDAQNQPLGKSVLRDMLKSMPSPFRRDKKQLRFFTSCDAETDYRDSLSERGTVVGDKFLEQDVPAMYSGVPVEDVPMFPENLGPGGNQTNALLTDPKNMNVGIWRNIRIETDKLIQDGVFIVVATLRFDGKYAEETAVVKAVRIRTGA